MITFCSTSLEGGWVDALAARHIPIEHGMLRQTSLARGTRRQERMRQQGMRRHYAALRVKAVSGNAASIGGVAGACSVTGGCGVRQCGVARRRQGETRRQERMRRQGMPGGVMQRGKRRQGRMRRSGNAASLLLWRRQGERGVRNECGIKECGVARRRQGGRGVRGEGGVRTAASLGGVMDFPNPQAPVNSRLAKV